MKTMLTAIKKEFDGTNLRAAICCLVLSIVIFFIMKVMGNPYGF